MRKLATLLFFLTISFALSAQTTGSFDTTLNFQSANRTISMYVPPTYNPSNPTNLMICLHGLGDNPTNYRNALVNSLAWGTHFPNTILACPASSAPNSDFYLPAGYEAIVQATIDMVKQSYQVDTNEILLQGFSLGGRAAFKYGLDHPTTFKGLLLNTPAIQGVKNANNGMPLFTFNYANASQIPIYITHGETDYLYTAAIDSTMIQLVTNNSRARFYRVPGLGHTIPAYGQMPMLSSFFNVTSSNGPDAEIMDVQVPGQTCQSTFNAKCLVRNMGNVPLSAMTLQYVYNGVTQNTTWSGNLQPYQHSWVNLPVLTTSSGYKLIDVSIQNVNSVADTFLMNNQHTDSVLGYSGGLPLTQSEGFEGGFFPPNGWLAERYGEDVTYFDLDDQVKRTGQYSSYAFNSIFIFDNQGRKAEMVSPPIQLNLSSTPSISFDYAFNYIRYTPPYFTAQTDFTDTLEILISTDCGQTFQSIYKKWGDDLATFTNPTLNPLDIPSVFINPADSNWKRTELDLSAYASATEAMVKFSYISGLGGNINLDNILFNNIPLSTNDLASPSNVVVYPNPASNKLMLSGLSQALHQVSLSTLTGVTVLKKEFTISTSEQSLDLPQLTPGLYMLWIDGVGKKIVIE
jgi:predicted esterase